jgi:hypothetical protein
MVRVMREAIAKAKAQGENVGSSEWSANVMEQSPVTIFIFNPHGMHPWLTRSIEQMFTDVVNVQSVGAASPRYARWWRKLAASDWLPSRSACLRRFLTARFGAWWLGGRRWISGP